MELNQVLKCVDIFAGLTDTQLTRVADIFTDRTLLQDEVLFQQGDPGDTMCVICDGFVEVVVESADESSAQTIVNLGPGQSVGEMALIDRGPRSATVRASDEGARVAVVHRADFERLCESDTGIGYRLMRNIAADLSFRLRRLDLSIL